MEVVTKPKRKQTTHCVANLKGASQPSICQQVSLASPIDRALKKIKFGDYEIKRTTVGPHTGQSCLRYYFNYKKCGRLQHVMIYKNGEWLDYPRDVIDLVKKELEIKKFVVEIELNGCDYMLDFLHMCQVDLKTGFQQPIAWINEAGDCFFPEVYATSDEEYWNLFEQEGIELGIDIQVNEVDKSKLGKCQGESSGLIRDTQIQVAYNEYVQGKLNLVSVQDMLLNGMSGFDNIDIEIVEIYRCSGASMQARLKLFQTQSEIIRKNHGDPNVRYAWIPFSKRELSTMMDYGLGHCVMCKKNKFTYNVGVHLAAVTCPYASARYCDIDESGVRHMVLCRVIMGNMKVLHPRICSDAGHFQTSSSKYDNGVVDDIQCPRHYIVWNTNINTHIYPEFVVSFKVSNDAEGHFCGTMEENNEFGVNSSMTNLARRSSGDMLQSVSLVNNGISPNGVISTPKIPKTPWLPFPVLIVAIGDKVPANAMSLIRAHYELYKAKRISRDDFVTELRLIVGDTILRTTIASLQFKIPSNGKLEGSNRKEC
ncbi:inactive poly [ADP-ribose] polymerase RCD1-like [Lotus japonicus]|uniref:inactive poly [ADP-ribose] polymerase RCD1-like n=1 Tax=Lotus japonicus TaxID=34305 RepID=UPI002587ABFC|nr:inactive poly [ADP-ribose] polymerase RCD1-like [Lotus japonicus]